jgi:hypothetical protein
MGELSRRAVSGLRTEREGVLGSLLAIREEDCRLPATFAGKEFTVNFLLRAFSLHLLDHIQHVQKLLRDRGKGLSEAQLLFMKSQALLGEFEILVESLSDEEFTAKGPGPEDWSAQQIVEHVTGTERKYREEIERSIAQAR